MHYGQHLLLGQPLDDAVEVLLSCEPPSKKGGAGAAYQMLGRFGRFGDSPQGRTSWNTTFMLVGGQGEVEGSCRVMPLAPMSYLHGSRLLQPSHFGLPNRVRGCLGRCAVLADGSEELLLTAAQGGEDVDWRLEPLQPLAVAAGGAWSHFARWDRLRRGSRWP